MAVSSTTYKVTFDLVEGVFIIQDTFSYPIPADIEGRITVTAPDGEVWYETKIAGAADVLPGSSPFNIYTINIPRLGDVEFEKGLYKFDYSVIDLTDPTPFVSTKTFEFCYKSPEVEIEMTADCIAPLLSSTDTTDYTVAGITPTITRISTIHYPISTGTNKITAPTQRITTDTFYTKTHTGEVFAGLLYAYPDDIRIKDSVTGAQEYNVVCDNTLCDLYCCLLAMYNRFKDAQSNNRTLAPSLEDKWVRAESIRSLIKDSYECNKQENVSQLVADILVLGDCQPGCGCSDGDAPTLISSIGSKAVTPTTIFSGGTSGGEANTASNLGTNVARKSVFSQKIGVDLQFKTLIAGSNVSLTETTEEITINAIVPTGGGSGSDSVVSAGSGIIVDVSVSGTTTTYSVSVEQDLLDKITALYNTTLVAGTGISLTPATDVDGNIEYTVASTIEEEDYIELLYQLRFDGLRETFSPIIELVNTRLKGASFKTPTVVLPANASAGFRVSFNDFFNATPAGSKISYIPKIEYLGGYQNPSPIPGQQFDLIENIPDHSVNLDCVYDWRGSQASALDVSAPDFMVRLYDAAGNLITGTILDGRNAPVKNLYFSIKIIKI